MTDRELLKEMFDFMVKRSYIEGTPESIKDMVLRYQQPPLTMYHCVCMQMTVQDYADLTKLLERVVAHFAPTEEQITIMPDGRKVIAKDDAFVNASHGYSLPEDTPDVTQLD